MSRFFDEDAREPSRRKAGSDSDTELTLGSGMLLTVFFGLVLLCGLCFGLGYALGSRGSKGPVFQSQPPAAGPSPQMPANSQQGKPSAAEQPSAVPAQAVTPVQNTAGAPDAVADQPMGQNQMPGAVSGTAANVASNPPGATQPTVAPNDSGWHPVQAALPGGTARTQSARPVSANQVRPALAGLNTVMVQIAALSNQEDADVLIGALRRRGYAVSAVRYPSDSLIHVCIGPFSNSVDANSMKQRLLSDGYNAQIVP